MKTRRPLGNEDTTHVKCKRCFFWCDTSRDSTTGSGDGISYTASAGTPDLPSVSAGCPHCGTFNYLTWQR